MTKAQIRWASEHDWFQLAAENGVFVKDYDGDKEISVFFSDFAELKAWAGY